MNLLNRVHNIAKPLKKSTKESLLLIDGDNISPKMLSTIISKEAISKLQVEIFCNTESSTGWIKFEKFSNSTLYLVKTKPQEADLRIKSRMIEILSLKANEAELTNIYFASNDKTFIEDMKNLSHKFNVTYISQHSSLCRYKNLNTININCNLSLSEKQLIKTSMPLVKVGSVLKINDIYYPGKLSNFLVSQGFKVSNNTISGVPYNKS